MRVFNDNQQILEFLTNDETFKDLVIDDEEHQANLQSGKFMLKGVRTLEGMFDLNKKFRNPANVKMNNSAMPDELINLGTEDEPIYVNLGKCCSPGDRSEFISLFQQYKDVFSFTYEDLKTYYTHIIQHVIPIKVGVKPFQQPLRKMNNKLEPQIQNDVKKLLDVKIIFRVRHLEWVVNMVPVRNKYGEIRLCVYFKNLNHASDKDNYPVPPMEQILQMVSGSKLFSLLDGFSGYNQVLVA